MKVLIVLFLKYLNLEPQSNNICAVLRFMFFNNLRGFYV